LARLLRHQARDGIFGYGPQPGHGDLSNSQYAALGLRAALWLGLEVPRQVWDRLASGTLSHQQADGGFGYVRRSAATLSMTTAGIAILELCRERLAAERVATGRLERSIAGGWRWLAAARRTIGDLRAVHAFYAHYGLERAAVLSRVERVGSVDWFEV